MALSMSLDTTSYNLVVVSYLRRQGCAGEYMLDILGVASTWVDD